MVTCNCKLPKMNYHTNCLSATHMCFMIMITIYLFLLLIPYATPLEFYLPKIGSQNRNRDIRIEGKGSSISDQGIQVTPEFGAMSAGRATYIQPLHLWDSASGEVADFNTNFSFVIDSRGNRPYGDGLTFFLAANNSVYTFGRALGLPLDSERSVQPITNFVAVEFDTFWNSEWDPRNSTGSSIEDHVGININSISSVRFQKWWSNITGGGENEARISYDSTSQNLSVVFTGYVNNTRVQQYGLHYTLDLRKELPEWVIFGFSAGTGTAIQTNNVKSWNFSSSNLPETPSPNSNLPQTPNPQPEPQIPIAPTPTKEQNKTGLIVGLSIGSCVLVGGLALVAFCLWKKRSREKKDDEFGYNVAMDHEFEMGIGPKKFSYGELSRATNNFSEGEKLGEGGFGGVYRGFLRELNSYVAVKRVSKGSRQGIKEYASEVKIISRLRHRNLVQLIGWCHDKRELLLVYEFMENGSLDFHLFKQQNLLIWGLRYKIAQCLASALLYLHEEWEQCVVHRDIKSSNIMLDSNFNAKLGDFGLARLVDHEKASQTTILAGTMGYMAPEFFNHGKVSKATDVFSFGIVALEIACGRKPVDVKAPESQIIMVDWVWDLYVKGNLLDAADPRLCTDFDDQEMERLMIVGLWCARPDYTLRPSIRQAIQVLNFDAPLPILPSEIPVPTYSAPLVNKATFSTSSSDGTTDPECNQIQCSNNSYNTDSTKMTTASAAPSPSASLLYTK